MFFVINVTVCLNLSLFRCMSCMWPSYAKGPTTLQITYANIGAPIFFSFTSLYSGTPILRSSIYRYFRFNDLTFCVPAKVTINSRYGAESRFNNIRFNDVPGITMEI